MLKNDENFNRNKKEIEKNRNSRGSVTSETPVVVQMVRSSSQGRGNRGSSQGRSARGSEQAGNRTSSQTARGSVRSSRISGPILRLDKRELHERLFQGQSEVKTFAQALEQRKKRKPKSRFVLPMQVRSDLKKAFSIFDLDGCGVLKLDDLRIAIRCLGFEPKLEDLNSMCALVGNKAVHGITYTEFEYIMTRTMTVKDTEDELRNAFKLFSKEAKGEVSFKKLKEVKDLLGESLNDEELKEMISAIDKNKNGTVSEAEFLDFCRETVLWDCKY